MEICHYKLDMCRTSVRNREKITNNATKNIMKMANSMEIEIHWNIAVTMFERNETYFFGWRLRQPKFTVIHKYTTHASRTSYLFGVFPHFPKCVCIAYSMSHSATHTHTHTPPFRTHIEREKASSCIQYFGIRFFVIAKIRCYLRTPDFS